MHDVLFYELTYEQFLNASREKTDLTLPSPETKRELDLVAARIGPHPHKMRLDEFYRKW